MLPYLQYFYHTTFLVVFLSCIKAANQIMYIDELPMFAYNLWLSCCALAPRYMYIMPMIVSICQHCDEQQFRNVMCSVYPTSFSQ